MAYTLTNPGNLGAFTATGSKTVSVNTAGVCGDRGMTSVRYRSGDTSACFTHTLDGLTAPSTDDPTNTNANLYGYRKPYVCNP